MYFHYIYSADITGINIGTSAAGWNFPVSHQEPVYDNIGARAIQGIMRTNIKQLFKSKHHEG